ncbi:hypothetical protein HPB50_029355 [Hyalomma asiaticum]|nr:hypothetical protein HPB50_029355 [Hyalomma asiaticum]
MGTPGEENCGGKEMLLQKGAFTDIDVAMMVHPSTSDMLRPGISARQKTTVYFRGKAAHAAVYPWEGLNALDAAVASYTNISLLRQQIKPTTRIHGIFAEAGTSCNVIPESSKLIYNIRGETAHELYELVAKVENCFQAAALATGCTMTMKNDILYKDFVHNTVLSKLYRKHGRPDGKHLLGTAGVHFDDDDMVGVRSSGAATDAGNVSQELPTLHPLFVIPTCSGNHTRAFAEAASSPEAQPPTRRAAKLLALTALDVLADSALLGDAQREFREWKSSSASK